LWTIDNDYSTKKGKIEYVKEKASTMCHDWSVIPQSPQYDPVMGTISVWLHRLKNYIEYKKKLEELFPGSPRTELKQTLSEIRRLTRHVHV
jgi:hypothetical protein